MEFENKLTVFNVRQEISATTMQDKKDILKELIEKQFPEIKGVIIFPKSNEIAWEQGCEITAKMISNFIKKL